MKRAEDKPEFIEALKTNPEAWKIYQEGKVAIERARQPQPISAALDLSDYLRDPSHLNTPLKLANPKLYVRVRQHREDQQFINTLKNNPEIWKRYEQFLTLAPNFVKPALSAAQATAADLIPFLLEHRTLPSFNSKDKPLYRLMHKHEDKPEFIEALKENPEAWKIYQVGKAAIDRARQPQPISAALDLSNYLRDPSYLNTPLKVSNLNLFRRVKLNMNDQQFIDTLKQDPEIWKRYERFLTLDPNFVKPTHSPAQSAAADLISFLLEHRTLPSHLDKDRPLRRRMLEYEDKPEFIEVLKENPEAWKIYQEIKAEVKRGRKAGT
jgi:GrpB-like predicted nucleotidyltransferase (UPF0157 family)